MLDEPDRRLSPWYIRGYTVRLRNPTGGYPKLLVNSLSLLVGLAY